MKPPVFRARRWAAALTWFGLLVSLTQAPLASGATAWDAQAGQRSWASSGTDDPLRISVNTDNDAFLGRGTDYGYTGGFSVTLAGEPVEEVFVPVQKVLSRFDRWLGLAHLGTSTAESGSGSVVLQGGLSIFTPRDLLSRQPSLEDRPYANLAYVALSHFALDESQTRLYQSTFTVGLLGTSMARELQDALHGAIGLRRPAGYGFQISDGGELTARYAVARHALLAERQRAGRRFDLKTVLEGSAGYLTEGSVGIGLRWGRIDTPWWSTPSEFGDYAAQPAPRAPVGERVRASGRTLYLSAGTKVRARLHNVFLQGQIRESAVTHDLGELRPLVWEAWLGVTLTIGNVDVTYALRHQTAELRNGVGAGSLTWAGLTIGGKLR